MQLCETDVDFYIFNKLLLRLKEFRQRPNVFWEIDVSVSAPKCYKQTFYIESV